jgi:hypothetical protein
LSRNLGVEKRKVQSLRATCFVPLAGRGIISR